MKTLADYAWSSHQGYLWQSKTWHWLYQDLLLSMLAANKSQARKNYLDFVSCGEPAEIERFYSLKKLPSILGGEAFKDWVKEKFQHVGSQKEIPDSRQLALEPGRIIDVVCDHCKISRDQLACSKRGKENLPRDLAIYLIGRFSRQSLVEAGQHLGLHSYSTVSSPVQRIKARSKQERSVRAHLEELRGRLKKRQRQT